MTLLGSRFLLPHINSAKERNTAPNAKYETYDILNGPIERGFDGVFALDVLEHIVPERRICSCKTSVVV